MFKDRLTLGYLLLVGIPLLFLVVTLRSGNSLAAPTSVAGEWLIEPVRPLSTCLAPLTGSQQATLNFSQSGPDLKIVMSGAHKTTFTGVLSGRRLTATSLYDGQAACGHKGLIHLDATVAGSGERRALQGQFRVDGCDSCSAVPFRASKAGLPVK